MYWGLQGQHLEAGSGGLGKLQMGSLCSCGKEPPPMEEGASTGPTPKGGSREGGKSPTFLQPHSFPTVPCIGRLHKGAADHTERGL